MKNYREAIYKLEESIKAYGVQQSGWNLRRRFTEDATEIASMEKHLTECELDLLKQMKDIGLGVLLVCENKLVREAANQLCKGEVTKHAADDDWEYVEAVANALILKMEDDIKRLEHLDEQKREILGK